MAVYVDSGKIEYRRMKMCHMIADTVEELHEMADKIGVKRQWFQNESTPHYDICQSKRELAISYGAIEADRKKVVELIRFWRAKLKST
jgi:hypothetical protein